MKKLLLAYGGAFFGAFVILYAYSSYLPEIRSEGLALKKMSLPSARLRVNAGDAAPSQEPKQTPAPAVTQASTKIIDKKKKRILLIGDSMMEGLMFRMKDYTEHNGHFLQPVVWYGSSTKTWGECDTLSYYIRKYTPDFVVVVLGGNELFIRGVEQRAPYVQHVLKQINPRDYIWIGPPNWKKDTGINELIKKHVQKGAYFPSKNLKLARRKDGAHPTRAAAAIWMDSVAAFMRSPQTAHPIEMGAPPKPTKATPKAILLRMPK
jgi:hypothetical protein